MSIFHFKSQHGTGGGIEGYSLSKDSAAYSAGDLSSLTVAQIKSLAASLGYSITDTKKADIIAEFLAQQGE